MAIAYGINAFGTRAYGAAAKTLYLPPRRHKCRVRVLNSGTWYDLTTRTASIGLDMDKDSASTAADVTFGNAPSDGDSLSPLVTPLTRAPSFLSPLQVAGGLDALPAGLLTPGAQIKVDAAFTTDGTAPTDADLVPVFHGVLGASVRASSQIGQRQVRVHALDFACKRLGDFFLNDTTDITAGDAEDVIQDIVDKALGAGVLTVYTPTASGATVTADGITNLCQNTTAWRAIQQIAENLGWDARYLYVSSVGDWRLVFQQPSRSLATPDFDYGRADFSLHTLDVTDNYVRNKVTVEYRDAATGDRATAAVSQATGTYGTTNYGPREVYITEADTSIIDSATEAQTMAQAILDDLKDLHAQVELQAPFDPDVGIYSTVRITDAQISDDPQTYAVDSIQATMSANEWGMTLQMSGSVAVRQQRWLELHGATGAKRPMRDGDIRSESLDDVHVNPVSNIPLVVAIGSSSAAITVPVASAGDEATVTVTATLEDLSGNTLPSVTIADGRTIAGFVSASFLGLGATMPAGVSLRGWSAQVEGFSDSLGIWVSIMSGPDTFTAFRLAVSAQLYFAEAHPSSASVDLDLASNVLLLNSPETPRIVHAQ